MQDLRFAFRSLARAPAFMVVAVAILALGIASNTVVFSLVNALFLKPLPFPDPEQLVSLDETAPKWNLHYAGINYDDFEAWRAQNETFTAMAHFRGGEFTLAANEQLERVSGQHVTHDLADVFGIRPVVGRMFTAEEELRGGPNVALLGHHIWQQWFQGDPDVVHKTITIDEETYEIIGVLPPTAVLPSRAAVWIPFASKPPASGWAGMAIGRLKSGATIEQAAADLLRIHRSRIPEAKENEITSPIVEPLLQRYLGGAGMIGFVLQGSVVVVLLIAGANVAGITLARTLVRSPELALRAALGASRARIVRLLLTESLWLALLGTAGGVLLGRWMLDGVPGLMPDLPAWLDLSIDWRFVVFISSVVLLCTLIAGLIPAAHILRRLDLRETIGGPQQTADRSRLFALRSLVVGEVACAFLLLLAAGFLGRAFLRVQAIDPGIRADHMLTYGILLPEARYRDSAARLAFFNEHLERVRALPQVEAASASTVLPFSGQHAGNFFEPEGGLPGGPDAGSPVVLTRISYPGYLETMGIALRAGRDFDAHDWHYKIIVNETLARLFWPGENAVGKRMRSRGSRDPWLEVIGVARDVRHYGLEGDARPGVYVPFAAMPQAGVGIAIRTKGNPSDLAPLVRTLLQEQDRSLPLAGIATMEQRIRDSLAFRRLYTGMATTFAFCAAIMAISGLYGLISYVVGQRTREFGIRLALGARAPDLVRLVIRQGATLALLGSGAGLISGVLVGRMLSGLMAGISPLDPLVLSGTTLLVAPVVLIASIVPALRTLRINPNDVLRAE